MNLPSGFLDPGKCLISRASTVEESHSLTKKSLPVFEPAIFVQCFIVLLSGGKVSTYLLLTLHILLLCSEASRTSQLLSHNSVAAETSS